MDKNRLNNNGTSADMVCQNTIVFETDLDAKEEILKKKEDVVPVTVIDIGRADIILDIKEEVLVEKDDIIVKDIAKEDILEIKEEVLDTDTLDNSLGLLNPDDPSETIEIDSSDFKKELSSCGTKSSKKAGADHNESSSAHICSFCQKTFEYPSALKRHLVKHTKERNFECHLCQRKFGSNNHVMRHYRLVHKQEPPATEKRKMACEFCAEEFTFKGKLTRHIMHKHTKEKKHACQLCPDRFYSNSHLQRHLRAHMKVIFKRHVLKYAGCNWPIGFCRRSLSDAVSARRGSWKTSTRLRTRGSTRTSGLSAVSSAKRNSGRPTRLSKYGTKFALFARGSISRNC